MILAAVVATITNLKSAELIDTSPQSIIHCTHDHLLCCLSPRMALYCFVSTFVHCL